MSNNVILIILALTTLSNLVAAQVSIYPSNGIHVGQNNPSGIKENGVRFTGSDDVQLYDIALDDEGRLSFYPDGENNVLAYFDDDKNQLVIFGDENNGTDASLRIISGNQTLIMDGNELDAFSSGINLNFNSSQYVSIANGGGGTSFNRSGPPEDLADIHLKQSAIEGNVGGMVWESSENKSKWKIWHSGSHFSFSERKNADNFFTRRAYIEATSGDYVQPSDSRLKEDITDIGGDFLSKVSRLKLKSYRYKNTNSKNSTIGFLAQDVQDIFPELVHEGEDGYLGLSYALFGAISIGAIQELNEKLENTYLKSVKKLEEENEVLKSTIHELVNRIEALEKK